MTSRLIYFILIKFQIITHLNGIHFNYRKVSGGLSFIFLHTKIKKAFFLLTIFFLRQYLPKINELCSAELLNSKFLVPCNPVEHLNADYGAHGWQTPKKSSNLHKETKESYTWPSLHFFNKSSDAEFLKSVKWYNIDGSLDNKTTFNFLNNGLDKKISMDEFNKLNIT